MSTAVATVAGTLSTAVFVASAMPMLRKAHRTRDLRSYSLGNLALAAVGNLAYWVYVVSLPVGPIWVLHGFWTLASTMMLWWYLRQPVTVTVGPDGYREPVRRDEKVEQIGEILERLYPEPPIPLDHVNPYTLLVAVALSAQTTDKKVNEITPALFAEASTPEQMYALGAERILELIREVGLAPTKARNVWTAAGQIVDAGGELKPDWGFLEGLAGVGHKTASVVMAQAFDVPAFPVDTHIYRLARRWGLSRATTVEKVEADLKKAFPKDTWNRRHLQIIYFGREYCPAQRHVFATCPICSFAATKAQQAAEIKARAKKPAKVAPAQV